MHLRSLIRISLSLLATLICVDPATSAWAPNGNPIAVGSGPARSDQVVSGLQAIPDGSGGAIIVWSNGQHPIAQRVLTDGQVAPGWPANGLLLCNFYAPSEVFPRAVSDGAGGAIVAWWDTRRGGQFIYAQRVTAAGTLVWPDSGVAIAADRKSRDAPFIDSDGSGGAVIGWSETDGSLRASRIDASGSLVAGWILNGNRFCTVAVQPILGAVVSDGAGGAEFAWTDLRDPPSREIYTFRLSPDGSTEPGWPGGGVLLCQAIGDRFTIYGVPDGSGGSIFQWTDTRATALSGWDLYAGRVASSGTLPAGWTTAGIPLCTAAGDQGEFATNLMSPRRAAVSDGAGGVMVVWHDARTGGRDIFIGRVAGDGSTPAGWAANGNSVCSIPLEQYSPTAAPDGAGGAFVLWHDKRNGSDTDLYLTRFTGSGSPPFGWPADGSAICTATGDQLSGFLCEGGSGKVIAVWSDYRRGDLGQGDIYALGVEDNGPVSAPNPPRSSALSVKGWATHESNALIRVEFVLASNDPARLEIIDVTGRVEISQGLSGMTSGSHVLGLDSSRLSSGVYFLRLTQDYQQVTARTVVIR